ncbi:hypothetical protein IAD21_04523 [Abditibacteriota bacterium]|nr:hypothetical protein IAD21_04523 [Abditibacteriota bacterium]
MLKNAAGSKPLEYLDFDLEIHSEDGNGYRVAVRSPAGDAISSLRLPFDDAEWGQRRAAWDNALQQGRHVSPVQAGSATASPALVAAEALIREMGQELFDALFNSTVRGLYSASRTQAQTQGKGLRVRLNVHPSSLALLPWECLYDPGRAEYLCLSSQTPLVRYLAVQQPMQALQVAAPLRVLGMVAKPSDQRPLDVAGEKRRIAEALRDLCNSGQVELHWLEGQTWSALQTAMRQGPWHIFHFIGHGSFDDLRQVGYLALADENGRTYRLSAVQLKMLLSDHSSLRLVVLNSCEGASGAASDVFAGSAASLVRGGMPATVAMQFEISDKAAIAFSRAFYGAIAHSWPVDAALVEARKAIQLTLPDAIEWSTPVLYMRSPDGILFQETPPVPASSPAPVVKREIQKKALQQKRDQLAAQYAAAFQNELEERDLAEKVAIGTKIKRLGEDLQKVEDELNQLN